MSEAVLWKVGLEDVIIGVCGDRFENVLITAAASGVALVETGGSLNDRDPKRVWKVAGETIAACAAVFANERLVVAAIVPAQASIAPPRRRKKGNKQNPESNFPPKSQLMAWDRESEGLINDMTLLTEIDGLIAKLAVWEDDLVVAITNVGAVYALQLVYEGDKISGKIISQVESVGIDLVKSIDSSSLSVKPFPAVVLAGSTVEGSGVEVAIAMWRNLDRGWTLRNRRLQSPSCSNGEDIVGFAAWATGTNSDTIAILWGDGVIEVFDCGELCIRRELRWRVRLDAIHQKSPSAQVKRKRRASDASSLDCTNRAGQKMVSVGLGRVAVAGRVDGKEKTFVGIMDTKFGKVSEILSVEDRHKADALLGLQESEAIILGGSHVALALYPSPEHEWGTGPILFSEVLEHDATLTDSMLKEPSNAVCAYRSDSVSVGLRLPLSESGDLNPQDIWIENVSQEMANRMEEIMQDIASPAKSCSQAQLARAMIQVLSLLFGDKLHGSLEGDLEEVSEDFVRKCLQDWKHTLNKEPSISKRIPSRMVRTFIEQFIVGKHWILLDFLIATNHIVSCERYPMLIPALVEERSLKTLENLFANVQEFSPQSVFQILRMILDSSQNKLTEEAVTSLAHRKRESVAAASESLKRKSRPRGEDKCAMVVAEVSCNSFSDAEVCLHAFVTAPMDMAVARAAVREFNLRQVLALLEYFGKWLDAYSAIDWISCLLDVHFAKLIHAEETQALVSRLQKSLTDHLTVSEHLSTLRGALHHIPRLSQMGGAAPSEDGIFDANPEMDLIIEHMHI